MFDSKWKFILHNIEHSGKTAYAFKLKREIAFITPVCMLAIFFKFLLKKSEMVLKRDEKVHTKLVLQKGLYQIEQLKFLLIAAGLAGMEIKKVKFV